MQIVKDIIGKISFLIGIFCMLLTGVIVLHPRLSMQPFFLVGIFCIHSICMIGAGVINWSNEKKSRLFEKIRIGCMIIFYLILLWQVVFGNMVFARERNIRTINLFPFKMITSYLKDYQEGNIGCRIIILNIMGNLSLLAPIGFFESVCIKKKKWLLPVMLGGISSLLVECFQFVCSVGRFDIDDIILNTLGVTVMYYITKLSIVKKIMKKFEIRY